LFSVVVLVALILWGVRFLIELSQVPRNAYATWDGACLVIDHLRLNNDQWPTGWNDLEATLAKGNGRTRFGFSVDELRHRINIEFGAKPAELVTASFDDRRPSFRVIRLLNGKDTHWEHAEPNLLVYQYLTDRETLLKSWAYHPTVPIP
jgi:hypothetical protein